jgi:hypothetical protein
VKPISLEMMKEVISAHLSPCEAHLAGEVGYENQAEA